MHAAAHTGFHHKDDDGRDDRPDSGSAPGSGGNPGGEDPRTTPAATAGESPACTAEQVRAALGNALESPEFRSAPQLRSFLDFVVCAALEERREKIKGYTIAVEALGRPQDFNPVTDPIVRVEAARLRRRLARYYSGSGARAHVRIIIPKGSYAPEFEPGPHAERGDQPSSAVTTEVVAPASDESAGAAGNSDRPAATDVSGAHLASPDGGNAEASPLRTYKVVQPLSGHSTQPLFAKRISLALALMLALACFLAGVLTGSL